MLIARAIGNERRLYILLLLLVRSYTGGELAEELGIHKTSMSKHLRILHRAGLIVSKRVANTVVFSIAPDCVKKILTVVSLLANKKAGHSNT